MNHGFRLLAVLFLALGAACAKADEARPMLVDLGDPNWTKAAGADFIGVDGAKIGQVQLGQAPTGLMIRIDLSGLSEGWHGAHLHQAADCADHADGFKLSKSHINPEQKEHGLLNPNGHKPANLPNIYAGPDGRATAEIYRPGASLDGSNGLLNIMDDDGFSVIIHANPDDHQSQPIGGSGGRVACAAIGG